MRPIASGAKLTYDDFLLFPDDGNRHELIDGEHYVTPSPNTRHQAILGNLYWLLRSYLEQHPIGTAMLAPFDVVFSHVDVVEPDLLYVSKARWPEIVTSQNIRGAPDLAVEIGSPSTRQRDRTIKRDVYQRFGVGEYWVIDGEIDTVEVYRRRGDRFDPPGTLSRARGDVVSTPLLPGFALRLADLFRD